MRIRVAIIVVVVVVVVLLWSTRAEASMLKPAGPSPAIEKFAEAIARAEGFGVDGAIPTRANNPGDLALGGQTIGAEGITVFSSPADGWRALYAQLVRIRDRRSSVYTPEMTIAQMGAKYAPHDGATWAGNVAKFLGVNVSAQLGDLLS